MAHGLFAFLHGAAASQAPLAAAIQRRRLPWLAGAAALAAAAARGAVANDAVVASTLDDLLRLALSTAAPPPPPSPAAAAADVEAILELDLVLYQWALVASAPRLWAPPSYLRQLEDAGRARARLCVSGHHMHSH